MREHTTDAVDETDASPGEFAAAIALGLCVFILILHAVHFARTGVVDWFKLLAVGSGVAVSAWIGGRGLLRVRTWRMAVFVFGFGLLLIGLWTLATGFHVEGSGQAKVIRSGDRLAEVGKIAVGFLLIGGGFLLPRQRRQRK